MMTYCLLKTGGSSIIMGSKYYTRFIPQKKGKLLKVTKLDDHHNELKYASVIKKIKDSSKYYSIPDEDIKVLEPSDTFYIFLKKLTKNHNMDIFGSSLHYMHVDYAGDTDVLSTLNNIIEYKDFGIWKSYRTLLKFAVHMLKALDFLHDNKVCHLDIKAENVVINTSFKQFRLIDFGYTTMYPFDDFVNDIKGTSCYFPKKMNDDEVTNWFPQIETNDMIKVNDMYPFQRNRHLVYKIDSYCLGRLLYFITYIYRDNKINKCIKTDKKAENKVTSITRVLLEPNIHNRVSVKECRFIFGV